MTRHLRLQTLGDLSLGVRSAAMSCRAALDLALLAIVVERSSKSVEHETLQAYFWGEKTEERARHSLRQAIMRLRAACGDALETNGSTLRISDGAIALDPVEFAEAAASGYCSAFRADGRNALDEAVPGATAWWKRARHAWPPNCSTRFHIYRRECFGRLRARIARST